MVKIVAHRGASQDAIENTVDAFDLAWQQGADIIEGDFWLTQDGHIICFHDNVIERHARVDIVVQETSFARLRELSLGHHRDSLKSVKIPELQEVLATIPKGKAIFIEIKSGTEIIPRLIEELSRANLDAGQVVFITFDSNLIAALKRAAPQYRAFWLVNLKVDKNGRLSPSSEVLIETLDACGADGLGTSHLISKSLVRLLKSHHYDCYVWLVDSVDEAMQFIQWGVDAIGTNSPAELKQGLSA